MVALQIAFASNLACEQATSNLAHADIKRRHLRNNKTFDVNPRISFCKQVNIGKKIIPTVSVRLIHAHNNCIVKSQ